MDHHELTNFLLKSNVPPSETESKRFRELIRASEAKYQSIATEVQALSEHRQAIQDQIEAFKNVVSPARRLPPETVTHIFRLCFEFKDDIYPNPRSAPLLLTQICSGWRQVALQTPDLWKDLYLDVEEDTIEDTYNLAKTWIERCRHHTYFMTILSSDILIDAFLNLLTIRPETVSLLEIEIPHDGLMFLEKLPSDVAFSSLEYLRVNTSAQDPDLEDNWLLWPDSVRVFESAPKLEIVSLTFQAEGFNPDSLHLPWRQLTDLTMNSPNSGARIPHNHVRTVLRKCTLLETCVVSLDTLIIEEDLNGEITLPHLEAVAITINSNRGTHFFDSMVLPQLQSLTLAVLPPGADVVDLRPIINLRRASNFSLSRFAIFYIHIDRAELLEILRLLPSLTDLTLTFVAGLDDTFFSAFEDNSSNKALLPNLSVLSTDCRSFPVPKVQAILESRGYPSESSTEKPPTVAKLKGLVFVVEVNFDQSVFKKFEDRGLELTLNRVIGRVPTPEPESDEDA